MYGVTSLTAFVVAVFTFPSVYCIDLSGKPLVVMNGKQTSDTLKSTLNEAFMVRQHCYPAPRMRSEGVK